MLARSSWMTFALRCASSTPRLACHAKHVYTHAPRIYLALHAAVLQPTLAAPGRLTPQKLSHLLSLSLCIQLWCMQPGEGRRCTCSEVEGSP